MKNNLTLSYLTIRKLIGVLGILFPLILVIGSFTIGKCNTIQPSISDYYHTNMRDVFVAYVCILSLFLIAYKGYDLIDNIVSSLAGISGFIVVLFPTALKLQAGNVIMQCNIFCTLSTPGWVNVLHLISAGIFILCLCYFSLFLFTKSTAIPTPQKLLRDRWYLACGYIMFVCICLLIVFFALPDSISTPLLKYKPVFWLETIAFIAFGLSWLVKGEFLLKDQ